MANLILHPYTDQFSQAIFQSQRDGISHLTIEGSQSDRNKIVIRQVEEYGDYHLTANFPTTWLTGHQTFERKNRAVDYAIFVLGTCGGEIFIHHDEASVKIWKERFG